MTDASQHTSSAFTRILQGRLHCNLRRLRAYCDDGCIVTCVLGVCAHIVMTVASQLASSASARLRRKLRRQHLRAYCDDGCVVTCVVKLAVVNSILLAALGTAWCWAQIWVAEVSTEICSNFVGRPVMREVGEPLSRRTFITLQPCAEGAHAARASFVTWRAR